MNLDTDLTLFKKLSQNRILDLNVKHKTLKLLQDNMGENLNDLVYGNNLLDTTPKVPSMKKFIDKLDFINI